MRDSRSGAPTRADEGMAGSAGELSRKSRIYVAGHGGLVGSAIVRQLRRQGCRDIVTARSAELDLRDRDTTRRFFARHRPDVVIDAAARVGGILANSQEPVQFLGDNLRIQLNLLDTAHEYDVGRLLFLGSSCIYPKFAPQPISEDSLLTGPLEETNKAYAIAKIAGIAQVESYRQQYGRQWISAMPTNLYGPGDNFDLETSHVLPAMLRKFHEAKRRGADEVVLWGSGTPRREFLHVDDLASACLFLLDHYDSPEAVNVGVGRDIQICELAELIAQITGFPGRIVFDRSKPDGTPRKLLDVTRLAALGWRPSISLVTGITDTYRWFLENRSDVHDPLQATEIGSR
jgi:GDP-L-fucose synthase